MELLRTIIRRGIFYPIFLLGLVIVVPLWWAIRGDWSMLQEVHSLLWEGEVD